MNMREKRREGVGRDRLRGRQTELMNVRTEERERLRDRDRDHLPNPPIPFHDYLRGHYRCQAG